MTAAGVEAASQTRSLRHRLGDALRTRTWQTRLLLVLILVVAAAVRIPGTRFGFPLLFHPDEWAVVDGVIDMARRNSFEPPWSLRPDHVEMKIDYLVFAGYAAVFKGMSVEAAFAADPVPFYWLARLVTATFGIATVLLAYLVGARWSRRVGLVAAGLFALFPAFVTNSIYATPDVPLTFALMLLVYALMRYTTSCSWRSLALACFAVALAVAIKYPGAVGAAMIAIVVTATAVRDRAWTRIPVHGAAAVGACLGFLFLISPTLFTDYSGIRRELKVQAAGDRLGQTDVGLAHNLSTYVETYFGQAGVVLAALGIVGLVVVVARRRLDVLPWFTGVIVWVSLSTLPMTWDRWGLPMWITPLLLASVGWCALVDRLRTARWRWVAWAAAVVVVAQLGAGCARSVAASTALDTRTHARAYLEERGIYERNTVSQGYSPFRPGDPSLLVDFVKRDGDGYRFLTHEGRPARYAVLSSAMYNRVLRDPAYHEEADLYHWLPDHARLVASFDPAPVPEQGHTWFEPLAVVSNLRYAVRTARGEMSGPALVVYEVPTER